MTVTDRTTSSPAGTEPAGDHVHPLAPGWRRSGLIGVATGLVSAVLVVGPVLAAWAADPLSSSDGSSATAVGASAWLLAGGAHLGVGTATIALTPLLLLGVLVLVARLGAREAMVRVSSEGEWWAGLLPRPLAAAVGAWWAGYAAVVGIGWVLAANGPLPPRPWTLLLPAVLVPLVGLGYALRAVGRDDPDVLGPRLVLPLPDSIRRSVGPGLAGAGLLIMVGMVAVLLAVLLAWPRVVSIQSDLAPSGVGVAVLLAGQLAGLANLGLWVVSFVAGPGFSVVEGASVTWDGSETGLLPMVPALGALPQPGRFPGLVGVVCVLLLVGAGMWVGRRAVATVARLARLRTKLVVAVSSCVVTALAIGLLDAVGGGSLGAYRLSSVGAPALEMALSALAWLVVGAVLFVLRDAWRLRR
ncbi:DUF6350 family protein [Phycicoccus sp. DTK01]|uniref:cell division protein PerM n=1 Tax=Phycicoccus sp. DTK01 TaxID=2785745 RepID=UPI001A8D6342|nr:DUF6350 family protein [Phycicoccus sp. DTK01]GIL36872.1 hypothetical protein PDTK01_29470 [Phycicoccus sp. DTK01]